MNSSGTNSIAAPALYEHCSDVWNAMREQAVETQDGLLWEGSLTGLFTQLGLSIPYYSKITKLLKGMDCMHQVRRGGGSSPSRWILLQEPSMELYSTLPAKDYESLKGRSTAVAMLEQQVRDLTSLVHQLRDRVEILEGIANAA